MTTAETPHGMILQLVTAHLTDDGDLFAELMAETLTREEPGFITELIYLLVSSSAMAQMSLDEWERMLAGAWAQVHGA